MLGKRTIKNFFNHLIKRLIKFVAKHNITIFIYISNLFFFFYYLLEKLRGRDSSRVSVDFDVKKKSLFIQDYSSKEILYFIIPSRVLSFKKGLRVKYSQLFKNYQLDKISFKKNDCVVDVGANIGEINKSLDKLDLSINYIGIEPSEAEFKALSLNCRNSEIYNIGCWDKNTELDFYISSESADSSFIHPSSEVDFTEKKEVSRLDSFISTKIKLLKIDAEGGEFEVLNGCHGILNLISYISVDVGFEKGQNKESTIVEVNKFLYENNFELISLGKQRLVALYKNNNLEKF